jgi:hypothetical protein
LRGFFGCVEPPLVVVEKESEDKYNHREEEAREPLEVKTGE